MFRLEASTMSYCPKCGSDYPAPDTPCAICATPFGGAPKKVAPIVSPYANPRVLMVLLLLAGGIAWHLLGPGFRYDQDTFLDSPALLQMREDLTAGRSVKARVAAQQLDQKVWWYTGIPSAVVSATYLQEHFKGDKEALDKAGEFAQQAYDREVNHISRYYLALYHYENDRFIEAEELLDEAYIGLIRRQYLGGPTTRQVWQKNIMVLQAAAKTSIEHGKRLDLRHEDWKYLL